MQIKIQLIVPSDDDQEETLEEVVTLEKEFEHLEQLGLTLTESKNILKQIQQTVIERQTAAYLKKHRQCERCGKRRKLKNYHEIVFRTLFGNIRLKSPRLYHCQCQEHRTKAFSPLTELLTEHTAPELLYLETKWASLVSYDKTAELLKEVLPIDDKINAASIENYGLRWHRGEVISTAFMESAVNQVINKRFCKKQQMQWTPKGAHLLLQIRTAVLNDELEDAFRTLYPGFREDPAEKMAA